MKRILAFSIIALAALLGLSSCTVIPLFEVDVIQLDITSSGTFGGATVTFRAVFDNGDSYAWDFGDGSTGSGQIVVHTYTTEGTFTVRLEITTGSRKLVASKEIVIRSGLATPAFPPRAFVLNNNDTLDVIDLDTTQILASISVEEVDWFSSESMARIAIAPNGTKAYVVHRNDDKLSVIDLVNYTNPLIDIAVGNAPNSVVFNPSGTRAYVSNEEDDTVSVINVATNSVIDTIPVGDQPTAIAIHPNGTRAYVANLRDEDISILNLATNTNLNSDIPIVTAIQSPEITSFDFSPDGTLLYGTIFTGNPQGVAVIDLVSETHITTIPITFAVQVVVGADGTRGYVTTPGAGSDITVLDLTNNTVSSTIASDVGINKVGVAISSDGTRLYVAEHEDHELGIIDLNTNTDLNMDIPLSGTLPLIVIVQD